MNREQSTLFRPDFYANKRTSQVLYGQKYYNKQLFTDKKLNQLKDWFRIGLYKSKAEMIYSEHHAEIVKPEQNVWWKVGNEFYDQADLNLKIINKNLK